MNDNTETFSRRAVTLLSCTVLWLSLPATAAGQGAAAKTYFTDTVLIDQHGEEVRFYSDVLEGRVVIIDSFFTSCEGICPVMSKSFAKLQESFGERLGRDVFLVSISVDPAVDTPQRLLAYAERFGARRGWTFLTGDEANVDLVLFKLGYQVATREEHANIMLMGNVPTGLWKKVFGLAPVEDLLAAAESVINDGE